MATASALAGVFIGGRVAAQTVDMPPVVGPLRVAAAPAPSAPPAMTASVSPSSSPANEPAAPATPAALRDANVRQVVLGIISYTRWPASPAKVRLCVVGATDYAHDLLSAPLPSLGLPVEAMRVSPGDAAQGGACEAIYVGTLDEASRRQLYAGIGGRPVLTISERNDSCTLGAMFCLNVDPERVTFDINLDTVARSGVRIHPNVLKLARKPGTP